MVPVPERCATSARIPYHRSAFRGFGFLCACPQGNPENIPPGVRSGPPRAAEDRRMVVTMDTRPSEGGLNGPEGRSHARKRWHGSSGTPPRGAPPARPNANPSCKHRGWGRKRWFVLGTILGLAVLGVVGALVFPATSNTLTWREEVALHDGGIVVVSRTAVLLPSPMLGERVDGKRQLTFTHPNTGKVVTWENAGELGSRVYPMLLDVDGERAFLVTIAQSSSEYNSFGCPTSPYMVYRHDGTAWTRVPLAELPARFRRANMLKSASHAERLIRPAKYYLTAAQVEAIYASGQDKNSPYVVIDRRIRNPLSLGCDRGTVERLYGIEKYAEWRDTGTWLDKSEDEVLKLLRRKGEGAKP